MHTLNQCLVSCISAWNILSSGLMIRPKYLEIGFNRSIPQQYNKYVQHLESFLQRESQRSFKYLTSLYV